MRRSIRNDVQFASCRKKLPDVPAFTADASARRLDWHVIESEAAVLAEDDSLGSDDDLVAVALRLLWDLDAFLADAAADRLSRVDPAARDALLVAIETMREALAEARPARKLVRGRRRIWPPRR